MSNIEVNVPQSRETLRSWAGIVEKASEYIYSSASNYVNGKGILEVTLADNPIVNVLNVNNVQRYEQC